MDIIQNKRELREAIVKWSNMNEFSIICSDIEEEICNKKSISSIDLRFDSFKSTEFKNIVHEIIDLLDKKKLLSFLINRLVEEQFPYTIQFPNILSNQDNSNIGHSRFESNKTELKKELLNFIDSKLLDSIVKDTCKKGFHEFIDNLHSIEWNVLYNFLQRLKDKINCQNILPIISVFWLDEDEVKIVKEKYNTHKALIYGEYEDTVYMCTKIYQDGILDEEKFIPLNSKDYELELEFEKVRKDILNKIQERFPRFQKSPMDKFYILVKGTIEPKFIDSILSIAQKNNLFVILLDDNTDEHKKYEDIKIKINEEKIESFETLVYVYKNQSIAKSSKEEYIE